MFSRIQPCAPTTKSRSRPSYQSPRRLDNIEARFICLRNLIGPSQGFESGLSRGNTANQSAFMPKCGCFRWRLDKFAGSRSRDTSNLCGEVVRMQLVQNGPSGAWSMSCRRTGPYAPFRCKLSAIKWFHFNLLESVKPLQPLEICRDRILKTDSRLDHLPSLAPSPLLLSLLPSAYL